MEGIINTYKSNPKVHYTIFKDYMLCSLDGIWFIEHESFQLEKKIEKLEPIIIKVLGELKNIDFDNKKNIIDAIYEKKDLLKDILIKVKEIKKQYLEYDNFYRIKLFEYYKKEYKNIIFDIFKKQKYLSIGIDIQILLKNKFFDFFNNYVTLIDKFIDINNYIYKVKILFNFEIQE